MKTCDHALTLGLKVNKTRGFHLTQNGCNSVVWGVKEYKGKLLSTLE